MENSGCTVKSCNFYQVDEGQNCRGVHLFGIKPDRCSTRTVRADVPDWIDICKQLSEIEAAVNSLKRQIMRSAGDIKGKGV